MSTVKEAGSELYTQMQEENLRTLVLAHRLIRSFIAANYQALAEPEADQTIPVGVRVALNYADQFTPRMPNKTYIKMVKRHESELSGARKMVDMRRAMLEGAISVESAAMFTTMLTEAQANLRYLETRGLGAGGPGDAMLISSGPDDTLEPDPGERALREVMGDD